MTPQVYEPDVCLILACLSAVLERVFQNFSVFLVGKTVKQLFSNLHFYGMQLK